MALGALGAGGTLTCKACAPHAGKSLTFQFPPHAAPKPCFTVVVGPLIALMRDQVSALHPRPRSTLHRALQCCAGA